jgi:hypothetical protein
MIRNTAPRLAAILSALLAVGCSTTMPINIRTRNVGRTEITGARVQLGRNFFSFGYLGANSSQAVDEGAMIIFAEVEPPVTTVKATYNKGKPGAWRDERSAAQGTITGGGITSQHRLRELLVTINSDNDTVTAQVLPPAPAQ